ncbi:hypothetical protein [Pseudoalteromonas luteoviolacea]|uniref:hypothetical protein n=1 Tax=Pseudoalteromonas luteoviolacea TaxID=43657 RepID=UPI001B3613D4|nr:hypothetical protein [Pseudoalteromonas luteoviolacea]MBQ4837688.1 hypothetical protein [Pseudoalteromonas luteoviolacea]
MYLRFSLIVLMVWFAQPVCAKSAEIVINEIKTKYKNTLSIDAFSLRYHFLNNVYRSQNYWDMQTPNRHMSIRSIDVDMVNKHFYDNDILYFAGGRLYDRVQFQNDTHSYFYEKNASTIGKGVLSRGMDNFDRALPYTLSNVDFLAIRPLLRESDIKKHIKVTYDNETNTFLIAHQDASQKTVKYIFDATTLRLKSLVQGAGGGRFEYNNVQTINGFTLATEVNKYYTGDSSPTYISFNADFYAIDKIDSDKLKLPAGYGPVIKAGDGVRQATKIAENLYVVTDSSARHNSVFQVNGDEITLFGASPSERVAKQTLSLIEQQFPTKRITSAFITHPHLGQIRGLKVLVEQGIEILADAYSISAIKAYGPFAQHIDHFKFKQIEHEQVIQGAQFYILENMSAKRQGFVYFKDAQIIFQSGFMHIPFDNTIATVIPNYTRAFIHFIRENDLVFKRIVGNFNNNNISVEVVDKTYEAKM